MSAEPEPLWLSRYRAGAPPEEVAQAWLDGLSPEEQEQARADAPAARAQLRRAITGSSCPEYRADVDRGFVYTGSVLRAADAVLGIPPPKPSGAQGSQPAPSGRGAPVASRCVVPGEAKPGTLGIWWSDFQTAAAAPQLRGLGITHRLNVAAEAVNTFPPEDAGLVTAHVPIVDMFSDEAELSKGAVEVWTKQLAEVLTILRRWRDTGAVVNISCQMGKNRSAAAVLVWLCGECGWTLEAAVERLREITSLACGNPHLIEAVAAFLQVEANVPLNPAGDGGGWICISPPGSPRLEGASAAYACQDVARRAFEKLGARMEEEEGEVERESSAEGPDVAPLFEDL